MERRSILTCPICGHRAVETMPVDACVCRYECRSCGTTLTPKQGDCCVFCSYGSVPCPPVQACGATVPSSR
ncbi:GDCCVxC domain-containing (seleno)protein [Rhizobium sp. BK181]|uniref:GDCCVxC domain-containing (seleno)protein n=1 Tax=Rhizobium sp. BK181 TaxID=2587072 RepID=UPI001FEE741D|nr:GDCCVxC domain-containing (seleno)protein [Rhizobium sp. BK181]